MGNRNKVVKLTDRKINYIIRAKTNNISTKRIALEMKLGESTVKRVWMYWIKNRKPLPIKKFGRKSQELDEGTVALILETHKTQNLGARRLEKIIEFEQGIHISHNKIHKVLLEHDLANENKKKKKRRKAWIRYEREHSLTAVHLDWHTSKVNGKEVCVVLDDSSRCVLAGDEFEAATTENSIKLMKDVLRNFGNIRKVEQVITDHGSQFYANKKDKNGRSNSKFLTFLTENKIKHIKARVKHPQTNGKIEKWYDTYEKHRIKFENFDKFVNWYNSVQYHESLDSDHYLLTPNEAFWMRLPDECKLNMFMRRMEDELNDEKQF